MSVDNDHDAPDAGLSARASALRHALNRHVRDKDVHRLGDEPFTVVSNDCWGAEVYRHLGRPYNTPFVGLFLYGPEYTRLVGDLRGYLAEPLRFVDRSRYVTDPQWPIGMLGDVEIELQHYATPAEAEAKWCRRLERFDWSAVRVKLSTGKDQIDDRTEAAVRALGGLVLTGRRRAAGDVAVRPFSHNGKRLFLRSIRHFDLVTWLASGAVQRAPGYARLTL